MAEKRAINKNLAFIYKKWAGGARGVVLEGSSRSGKTWSWLDFIINRCANEKNIVVNIIRETFSEFKTTLYNDFNQRLPMYGVPSPVEGKKEIETFFLFGNKINFLGADKPSKFHGAGCDYLILNEALPIPKPIFDQAEMRCDKFFVIDYNPFVTQHWIFDSVIPRPDVGYLHSTFKDNPQAPTGHIAKIKGYEPTQQNIENGTADEYMWKVYGLGLRGAMEGQIFRSVKWIDRFPEMGYIFGLDFGFTTDPTVLVRYAEDANNIYIEPLSYEPIDRTDVLAAFMRQVGVDYSTPVIADSADKYTGENKGTIEMVKSLREAGFSISKVSKRKSVMFWLTSMKTKKIHIVKNSLYIHVKKEVENYRMKMIHGISINQPVDEYNHIWDAARYCHMSYEPKPPPIIW